MSDDVIRKIPYGNCRGLSRFFAQLNDIFSVAGITLHIGGSERVRTAGQERIQFGTMILVLDSNGRGLTGLFVGYGRFSQDLIRGKIALKKVA